MFFKRIRQVIRQEDEFYQMRAELMDHCNQRFADSCSEKLHSFYESLRTSLLNGDQFDHAMTEKAKYDSRQACEAAQMELEQIQAMSDGEVKQLYFKTFGRWHPSGY